MKKRLVFWVTFASGDETETDMDEADNQTERDRSMREWPEATAD